MIELDHLRLPEGPVTVRQEWLAKGLRNLYYAPHRLFNLAGPDGTATSSAVIPTAPYGFYGLGLKAAAGGDYATITQARTAEYTIVAVLSDADFGSIGSFIDDDDGATRAYQYRVAAAAGGIDFIPFNTAGSAFTATTGSMGADRQDAGFVTVGRVMGAQAKVWATGVVPGTATITGTPQTRNATARLFQRKAGTQNFVGRIHMIADFAQALSEGDVLRIMANPAIIFEPFMIYARSSAVGGTTSPYYAYNQMMAA